MTDPAELQADVDRAGEVQRMLVPPEDDVTLGGLHLFSIYEPASGCGGDWWTGAPLPNGDSLLFLGDVTGHGAASAVITGVLKGAFEVARLGMGKGLQPDQLMTMLNRVLGMSLFGKYLVTAVAIRHNAASGEIAFSNAGHPAFWRARPGDVRQLRGEGDPALGISLNQKYETTTAAVLTGDILVLFSDGITECEDAHQQQLGERAVQEVIELTVHLGPQAVRDAIRTLVANHVHLRDDDHTLVVAQIL